MAVGGEWGMRPFHPRPDPDGPPSTDGPGLEPAPADPLPLLDALLATGATQEQALGQLATVLSWPVVAPLWDDWAQAIGWPEAVVAACDLLAQASPALANAKLNDWLDFRSVTGGIRARGYQEAILDLSGRLWLTCLPDDLKLGEHGEGELDLSGCANLKAIPENLAVLAVTLEGCVGVTSLPARLDAAFLVLTGWTTWDGVIPPGVTLDNGAGHELFTDRFPDGLKLEEWRDFYGFGKGC
jgi:hypothetical protein